MKRLLARGLVVLGAVTWCAALIVAKVSASNAAPSEASVALAISAAITDSVTGLNDAYATVVDNNVFSLERRPAVEVPAAQQPEIVAAPPVVRPVLTLSGIVGGPPWSAVIEGVPGRSAPLVARAGDRDGPYQVLRVTRDTVVVQGSDTTWHLTLRRFQ